MPDISMCANGAKCKKKDTCYRYKAKPSQFQSYSMFYKEDKECEDYLKIENKIYKEGDNNV